MESGNTTRRAPHLVRNELRKDVILTIRITINTRMSYELTLECFEIHDNYIIA